MPALWVHLNFSLLHLLLFSYRNLEVFAAFLYTDCKTVQEMILHLWTNTWVM